MRSYAEHLGIDLVKLEAERHHYYEAPTPKYSTKAIIAPPESSEDWQPIARAANGIGYNVDTLRRWTMAGKIRWQKRKGRTFVYFPDVIRHAGKA
jgi:hypothetical protein